jgi:hypothetical protein
MLLLDGQVSTNVQRISSDRQHKRDLSPTILKIAATAVIINMSEILTSTILGVGSKTVTHQAGSRQLAGFIVKYCNMEGWRVLALRCIASLFRL